MAFSGVCLHLIIFLRFASVLSNSDYYFYQTDFSHHKIENPSNLQLLENKVLHTNHKRDLPDVIGSISSGHIVANLTESPNITEPILPPKKKLVKLQRATPYPINMTKISTNKDLAKKYLALDSSKSDPKNITLTTSRQAPRFTNNTEVDHIIPTSIPDEVEEERREFNRSLAEHNITAIRTDNNKFYNSTYSKDPKVGRFYWVDFENRTDVKTNDLLSKSHRRAATIKLSFVFPFYGHLIKNVTIATGGFLYTGDYVHSWLAATQYIAPLMANFDTSLSNDSFIKYVDNGTAFTVQWEKVSLQEKPNDGEFTFQVTLLKNGDIIFVYHTIPFLVEEIQDVHHPVKIGVSDAYIMDRTVFFVRRKTIYEYDRVNFPKEDIKNWTVIYLKALPTCLDSHTCTSCVAKHISFECKWCPSINKCSTGIDRHRQDWTMRDCDTRIITNQTMCTYVNSSDVYFNTTYNRYEKIADPSRVHTKLAPKKPQENVGVSGIIAILFLLAMVFGLALWIFYAYRNPHTISGQILIRYRPSQWRWRRGEARYTAATIHM